MTPDAFIAKWRASELKERSAAQEHFIDLCRLLGEPTPAEADPSGETYCFERGARKDSGAPGWADVWKRHHFAWEYKGKDADLDAAFGQLRQYALALENPPLLIVSDMERFRLRTNWTNTVSETREVRLEGLADPVNREVLKWALSDPERLRPGLTRRMLTERAAAAFAELARSLRAAGHDPREVAHFVNRLVFCMFAEDVGLLPDNMFTRMLEHARRRPEAFAGMASALFGAMADGGLVGFEPVDRFDGGLFDDASALPLDRAQIEAALAAAALDWSEIDPSILGALFERGLNPAKRAQLGAHYTDRDKIEAIVAPAVSRPLAAEWEAAKAAAGAALARAGRARGAAARARAREAALAPLRAFLARLGRFTVLDPACGSGNFLYLALGALKDLEHRARLEAEAMGLERGFPAVGPANLRGIEIDPYAAELARVSVWIGEIQWLRRNNLGLPRDPVLRPLETIECRDAILSPDGGEPDWPEADVVIGNPPFLGVQRFRSVFGDEYTDALRATYEGRVPGAADLVCFWFQKAGRLVAEGKLERAGLVATNSIRGGANRAVLDRIAQDAEIFDAWSDEPWVVDGVSVRVSIVCFASANSGLARRLDGVKVPRIGADLTSGTADLLRAVPLAGNRNASFRGTTKNGPFDIPGDLAREWLRLPANPNGRSNSDVLKPWVNGMDITGRPAGKWIIDFGWRMSEAEAALYEAPFQYAKEHVWPMRQRNRRDAYREFWWRHGEARPGMWRAFAPLSRYIATPMVSKHRLFVWRDIRICPDQQVIAIARDDDATFGVLHSRFHEAWSLRLGTSLEDRPRYTPTTTFETFPFPPGLSPDIPAAARAADPRAGAIAAAARRLSDLRERWLNPPEWVEWREEPAPNYPPRPTPRDAPAAHSLRPRTLTALYNARPQWLADAHDALDEAVATAYGWDTDISEQDALAALLEMNVGDR